MNKRGISALVATVLTILITVAGIGIIWVAIVPMINENIAFDELDGRVTISTTGGYTVYDSDADVAIVQVKRDVDEGVMNRIKIIFMINGESVSSNVVAPESGQTKTYTFDLSGYSEPESVSAAAIFVSASGKEKEGSVTSKVDMPSGVISEVDADVLELERDYFTDAKIPMTGLVSWWKFDGDATDSVGENDGSLIDNEGNGLDSDEYLNLDGVDDYVDVDSNPISLSGDFSLSGWVRYEGDILGDTDEYSTAFGSATFGSSVKGIVIRRAGSSLQVVWGDDFSMAVITVVSNIDFDNKNKWYYVTIIYNSAENKISAYVDGEFIKGYIKEYSNSGFDSFQIGQSVNLNMAEAYWHGGVDDVMIYNKALSTEEVLAIYENQMK